MHPVSQHRITIGMRLAALCCVLSLLAAVAIVIGAPRVGAIPVCPPDDPGCNIDPPLPPLPPLPPDPGDDPADPPAPGAIPVASFTWAAQHRFERVWDSYDPATHTYDHDLVDPTGFTIEVDACSSSGRGNAIATYEFAAPAASDVEVWGACHANITYNSEGTYDVSLTVTSANGQQDSVNQEVVVDDLLVVALGDSAASGEGNPDDPFTGPFDSTGWHDRRCHQSKNSGIARAAAQLETSRRSVTFVSFACSGASITRGLLKHFNGLYDSVETDNPADPVIELPPIPAQLVALHALLCDVPADEDGVVDAPDASGAPNGCEPSPRPVDAIWMSAGVNDLDFAKVIAACATDFWGGVSCDENSAVIPKIGAGLADIEYHSFDIDFAMTGPLVDTEVYVTEYPDDPFDSLGGGDGCGVLFDVDDDEARWLYEQGQKLNEKLQRMSIRYGWHYVGGIADDFHGHGYCDDDNYFVTFSESMWTQLNYRGTLHPNAAGHALIAERIIEAYEAPKPPEPQTRTATVVVEAVKVDDDAPLSRDPEFDSPKRSVDLHFALTANTQNIWTDQAQAFVPDTPGGHLSVPNGQWVTLDAQPELTVDAKVGQTLRMHADTRLGPNPPPLCPHGECADGEERALIAQQDHVVGLIGAPEETQHLSDTVELGSFQVRYRIELLPAALPGDPTIDPDDPFENVPVPPHGPQSPPISVPPASS